MKKKFKCTTFDSLLSLHFIELKRLEKARHQLFTINLHHYIQTDEDLTQSLIDLAISREEKQLKLQDQRLQIKASRGYSQISLSLMIIIIV